MPSLVVARGARDARALAALATPCATPAAEHDRQAVALAVGSLPPGEAAGLARELDALAGRLRALANPLWVDLSDEAPEQPLRRWAEAHRPTLEAARALALGCWTSPDGALTVAVVARCPSPGAGLRCVPAWGERGADTPEAREAFLAWPLAHALVFRATTATAAAQARRSLRALIGRGDTEVAMVLPEVADEWPDGADVGASARALVGLVPRDREVEHRVLAALAHGLTRGASRSWEGGDARRIVVVPRLSAPAAPAEWAHAAVVGQAEHREAPGSLLWEAVTLGRAVLGRGGACEAVTARQGAMR